MKGIKEVILDSIRVGKSTKKDEPPRRITLFGRIMRALDANKGRAVEERIKQAVELGIQVGQSSKRKGRD